MSAVKSLEMNIDMGNASAPSGLMEETPCSPAYLSVGSDDGSATEVYYSAEEDNAESGDERPYETEAREVNGLKEVGFCESFLQQEITDDGTSKGDLRGEIVQMEGEGAENAEEDKREHLDPQTEMQLSLSGTRAEAEVPKTGISEILTGCGGGYQQTEAVAEVLPQMKEGEERMEELLATPVQQVNMLSECELAPPSSNPQGRGEGSDRNWTTDVEDSPNREEHQTQYLSDSFECTPAPSSKLVAVFREAEQQVPLSAERGGQSEECSDSNIYSLKSAASDNSGVAEVATGTLTRCAELQSDAEDLEHNRASPSSEWEDTITQSSDTNRTVQEQVAVVLSVPNADTRRPDNETAGAPLEVKEHQGATEAESPGSLTAASESQQTEVEQELADNMNSGYSSLSTTLSIKHQPVQKGDESKQRFRKVSLVNDTDTMEVGQDTVDFRETSTPVTETNGTDHGLDNKWRNKFDGVYQFDYKTEMSSFPDSLSSRVSDMFSSTSSVLPEATAYTLSDRTEVYPSRESEPTVDVKDEWRWSFAKQEESFAPAGEGEGRREGEAVPDSIKSCWDSQQLSVSAFSSELQPSNDIVKEEDSSCFTGVFQATLVELVDPVDLVVPAASFSTCPASPDLDSPSQFDMESLVDTLKNMGPSLRPRGVIQRGPPQVLMSSLPPIVEDAFSPAMSETPASPITTKMAAIGTPAEPLNGLYTLPPDLGLKRNTNRDTRSPLELMKQGQQQEQTTRGLTLPLRASTASSIVMKRTSDSSPEELKSPVLNGIPGLPSSSTGSRLDNSVIFGSYRSPSLDQAQENGKPHRTLFRTGSLPETGLSNDRKELGDVSTRTDSIGSRFEHLAFPFPSPLAGAEDPSTITNRFQPLSFSSPSSSLSLPSPTLDFNRPLTTTDSPLCLFGQTPGMGVGTGALGAPLLQRNFSHEGTEKTSLFSNFSGGSQIQKPEPERNPIAKYRAFPDAYLTKEKEHGKLNPRPGKMYIFDRPGMCGRRIEVRSDVVDAMSWELQEIISIRVVRGGWVLYEKPDFKGERIALDEGDIELGYPFSPPEEEEPQTQMQPQPQPNGPKEADENNSEEQSGEKNGETSEGQTETRPARRFIIGSIRRAVRDYSVPEISLFPEENAEGKKVIFRDTSEDARIFGFPIKANSIIINAGLWLVYAQPFFEGVPRVLEVGGYSNPAAWGVEHPYVGSLHPLKVGEPRVEILSEPKMVIYDKPYFTGKSRTICANMRDFMTRIDRQQTAFMYSVGSLKILGGIWVGYEKEGFRGHQYLLEEGDYHDWRVWGGCNSELRSVRLIRADLTDPLMVMFEQSEEQDSGMQEENSFEVTEAIPDVELFGYKTSTRSIQVLSGAWVAYSHVDFSGNQYILEKGFYNNCADWGSQDNRICSVQPILLAPSDSIRTRNELILYPEPDFQGEGHIFDRNQEAVTEKLLTKSCRVSGGSWVLYENKEYSGNLFVLSEGDYPDLTSMGCPPSSPIRSVKAVPLTFSVPSISLFGLECLEGREITTDLEIPNIVDEGFNNHILSLRVNSGCWVICEHSNFRGRQFLLEPIEITNWPKFSSIQTIGSMYPVRQKRHFFRIKNKERGHFMSVQGGVEELKSGRVVVTAEAEPMSDVWFYQDGFIKSKLAPTMSLQVMTNVEPGAKVVLWAETRQPIQTWTAQMKGLITNLTFPGMVLDVKGGKSYDKDQVVIMPESDERPSQQWEVELL
ncbi:uncharacterized protein crybg2 [Aulostomus maculatus]